MRRFHLQRDEDESGVSGTGIVAEGVQFGDGSVCLRWGWNPRPSWAVWPRISDVLEVHGHGGATRVVWLDPDTDGGSPVDLLPRALRLTGYPDDPQRG